MSQRRGLRCAPAALALAAVLFVAGAVGTADPEPPGGGPPRAGRAIWQLGEDGGLKLAGASPPVAPRPKFWTFNTPCKAGVCSGLCFDRTHWYDSGKCMAASSGRRYCKCWRDAPGGGAAAPPAPPGGAAAAERR